MDKVRRGKFRKMVKHKGDGMKHIYKFCKDAIHISGTTHEIESLSDYKINIDMNMKQRLRKCSCLMSSRIGNIQSKMER